MQNQVQQIKDQATAALAGISDPHALQDFEIAYLGRKGKLTEVLRGLKDLPEAERRAAGSQANEAKQFLVRAIEDKRKALAREPSAGQSVLSLTWPGEKIRIGHLHPLTQFQRKVEDIFISMGFEILSGPEIETPKYNFDLLNIPKDHPARDLWDTFYLEQGLLLRTHTSPMQLRAMEQRKPPVRLLVPGRTYRHEATDASHEAAFYQYEGLVIDRGISVANLLSTLELFFRALYGKEVQVKARSSFFPFTEPSLEIAMSCLICRGTGCPVCQQSGWLEMLGAGLVHPQVLRNMRVDPEQYSGFAFGGGLDRLAMLYHGINDIRLSYSGNLDFIEQF